MTRFIYLIDGNTLSRNLTFYLYILEMFFSLKIVDYINCKQQILEYMYIVDSGEIQL